MEQKATLLAEICILTYESRIHKRFLLPRESQLTRCRRAQKIRMWKFNYTFVKKQAIWDQRDSEHLNLPASDLLWKMNVKVKKKYIALSIFDYVRSMMGTGAAVSIDMIVLKK